MAQSLQPRWLVPEVVQTSAMDCGPAALKCLLQGFNIAVSYGRLREACQTSVDGTSIDRLEEVANQLGLQAEQTMLPLDYLFLPQAKLLPALFVVRHPDGATHFVVVWRQHGQWLQVMDPATGRRWLKCAQFMREIYRHEFEVTVSDWQAWASSEDFARPLNQRLSAMGISTQQASELLAGALEANTWFALATLDASVRLAGTLVGAGGLDAGQSAYNFMQALLTQIDENDIFQNIPLAYWSVLPLPSEPDTPKTLQLNGAVLLKVTQAHQIQADPQEMSELSPELAAALKETPVAPTQALLELLRLDGLLSPLVLSVAIILSVAAVLLETLLFRGVFDIAWQLNLVEQRLGAMFGLGGFVGILLLLEIPIAMETLRLGRHLDTRLRLALLRKLPHLADRYFQSRPISDMAERSHSIALTRQVPSLGIQWLQTLWDIVFTLLGIRWLDSASAPLALLVTLLALGLPWLGQALLNERDLKVRSHAGAMFSFYLDALLGLVPIQTHRAEPAISREHEGLLVEWSRAARSLLQLAVGLDAIQGLVCTSLVGLMLWQHFLHTGAVVGTDLLLIYWALKLPALGQRLTSLAQQYPAQRNILLRLLEPLGAPDELDASSAVSTTPSRNTHAVAIEIQQATVLAGGHTILENLDLQIAPGEQLAIVGPSGAGKSSLLAILLGWHRLASGSLKVDGLELQNSQLEALRREIAWVDPAVQIWNQTFLDNVYYSSANENLQFLAQAIDAADLRAVLQKLPHGLQSYLGESGALLSGGEGQRVRLARALMQRDARLVLLDEPFRGLDREQRQKLLNDTRSWWPEATLLCVTHDIAETMDFPRVLVIDEGRIIEQGSPQQLMQQASRYRELIQAEHHLREQLWQGHNWRRLQVAQGKIFAADATDSHA